MPGRQPYGGQPSKKPKGRANNQKRSINAFAIASQQHPEKTKTRRHRLGDIEGDDRPKKRMKAEETSDVNEESTRSKQERKRENKSQSDKLDIDAGSDSEGNEWRMGHVDSDNDSDLDSDEAFGDSDEEKFEGFVFSGSSAPRTIKEKREAPGFRDITLDETDNAFEAESILEGDDLGEDAIDLAAMLDITEEDSEENSTSFKVLVAKKDDESGDEISDVETENSDDVSSVSAVQEHDEEDPEKISALQNLIASLPQADSSKGLSRQRGDGASEYNMPSDFGITSKAKLTLEDLGLSPTRNPFVQKSLKLLASETKYDSKGVGARGKLEVPLERRQQDRLDRIAAYDKSRETLGRWTDTVKHNRQADHLVFPLADADTTSAKSNIRLQPTSNSKPFNDLEATIQTILQESGLAAANRKNDEDRMMELEELEINKMPLEEVKARRAQLRMARDLLFREEARSKRIKKIKSKSYRKVHRKQREKENRMNRQTLIEGGAEFSEDEQELQDRRRAEERMGSKHRNSKWAKATKQAGRAAWDEDARAGISEMARRDEELRKRVEGRAARKDSDEASEFSESNSEDGSTVGEITERDRLLRKLESVKETAGSLSSGPGSKLSNMKFMLKAEASRKKENDATVEQIIRDLASEDDSSHSSDDSGEIGRRTFGPGSGQSKDMDTPQVKKVKEYEEHEESGDEDAVEIYTTSQNEPTAAHTSLKNGNKQSMLGYGNNQASKIVPSPAEAIGGAWSSTIPQNDTVRSGSGCRNKMKHSTVDVGELDISNATVIAKQNNHKKRPEPKLVTMQGDGSSNDDSDGGDTIRLPYAIRDQELIKRAFAGADVVGEFENEKQQTIMDEDEKIVDNTLPGWGSWVGDGISKKDRLQNKGRFVTKIEGIKEQDRKDAKLDRVIINERRIKKNGKYLASNLPHPFETRQQYERSLRLPVGPEWTTKETFQDATKPRVLMKQGIITPMSKPLF